MCIFVKKYIMKYKLTNDQKLKNYFKAVEMRLEGATVTEIIQNTDFPTWRVLEFFMTQNKLTLPLDKAAFNKQVDVNFFKTIDSENKAYILGFLYADGCVYDSDRIGLCLSEEDNQILEFIKKEMKSTAKITTIHNTKSAINRKPQSLLRISSTKIVEQLLSYGVQQNKTLKEGLVFPVFEPHLISSFLRGLSDGDGNIYLKIEDEGKLTKSKFRWTLCMTDKSFLLKLKSYFELLNIDVKLYEKQGKTCKYYIFSTSSRDETKKVCDLLYSSKGFFLPRKKEKYLEYIKLLENTVLS